jgi:hypothetical protein
MAVSDTTGHNQGTVGAPLGSITRLVLSIDAILDAGDVPLGSRTVAALGRGASSTKTTAVTIPRAHRAAPMSSSPSRTLTMSWPS